MLQADRQIRGRQRAAQNRASSGSPDPRTATSRAKPCFERIARSADGSEPRKTVLRADRQIRGRQRAAQNCASSGSPDPRTAASRAKLCFERIARSADGSEPRKTVLRADRQIRGRQRAAQNCASSGSPDPRTAASRAKLCFERIARSADGSEPRKTVLRADRQIRGRQRAAQNCASSGSPDPRTAASRAKLCFERIARPADGNEPRKTVLQAGRQTRGRQRAAQNCASSGSPDPRTAASRAKLCFERIARSAFCAPFQEHSPRSKNDEPPPKVRFCRPQFRV